MACPACAPLVSDTHVVYPNGGSLVSHAFKVADRPVVIKALNLPCGVVGKLEMGAFVDCGFIWGPYQPNCGQVAIDSCNNIVAIGAAGHYRVVFSVTDPANADLDDTVVVQESAAIGSNVTELYKGSTMACGPNITLTNGPGNCTTIVVDSNSAVICPGSIVSAVTLEDYTVLTIDGAVYTIPHGDKVTCVAGGIEINGVFCATGNAVSFVDNGDCTGTVTIDGVAHNVVTEAKATHDPASISSSDSVLTITPSGQSFDIVFNEGNAVGQIVANSAALTALCAGLQACIDARIAATVVSPTSLPPSGPAGGDLSGTYPDPTVNWSANAADIAAALAHTNCTGAVHPAGASIPSCAEMTTAIADAIDSIPEPTVAANAPLSGDGSASSPLDIDFTALSSADTAAILSSLDLNNCAGANHQVGASIPSCAEMNTAIADAIGGISTAVVTNVPITGNGTVGSPLDINFASLSSADSSAILSSLDLNNCAGANHQVGASIPSCTEMNTAITDAINAQVLVSADTGNVISAGSDGGAFFTGGGSSAPTGPASGDLVGNYPNPTVNWNNAPIDVTSQTAASNPLTRGLSAGQVNKLISIPAPYADISGSSPDLEVSYRSMTKVFSNRAIEGGITDAGIMNTDGSVGHATLLVSSAQEAIDNNGATWRIAPNSGVFNLLDGVYAGQVMYITTAGGIDLECVISGTFSGTIRKSDHSIDFASGVADWIFRRGESAKLVWSGAAWWIVSYNHYLLKGSASNGVLIPYWREEHDGTLTIRGTVSPVPPATVVNEFFPVTLTSALYTIAVTPHQTSATPDVESPAVQLNGATWLTQFGIKHDNPTKSYGYRYTVTKATPDYTALGGIASF